MATAPAVVSAAPVAQGITYTNPACPGCGCLFNIMNHHREDELTAERNKRLLEPIDVTCHYCPWSGQVTFIRLT